MTRDLRVMAREDFMASLSNASPLAAVEELVWNALDADAREVKVDLVTNPLGGIDAVRVVDDGVGVDPDLVEYTFGSLGGSWKRGRTATEGAGRRLHGRRGRGRFKAFALGTQVAWTSTFAVPGGGLRSCRIAGDLAEPGLFRVEDIPAGPAPGTEVLAVNVRANAAALLDAGAVVQTLASKFALYLKAYPNVRVYFAGIPVTPIIVQKHVTDYPIVTEAGGEARLEVIEWRRRFPGSGRLVFCGKDGFALREQPAGVRPGASFSFTAYLVGERFSALHAENALVMDELNPEVRAYLDAARKRLRDHFRVRAAEDDASRAAAWTAEGSYPFAPGDSSPLRARFDDAVRDMRSRIDGFDALTAAERGYLFGLLKKTLEV